jgi:hypothetical protein
MFELPIFRKLSLALVMFGGAAVSFAQVATDASITGTVTDTGQLAVQGAVVTATDVATGVATTTKTNDLGQYRTPPLKIGTYTVTIESAGFKQFKEVDVILDIGSIREINAALTPGEVIDTVNVQATTEELLQKSDSTVGTVFTTQQIEELPLNGGSTGRDYLQLASVSAGTESASQGVSIGGQAGTQAAFLLDGLDNNNQEILTSHSNQKEIIKPSVDAISEFKVVTTSYSAEYGRSSSGVVSVNIKSGTNQIHGSAFEFIRNDAVDALPYLTTVAKLPYKYNDFGGTLGGPIRKDRTFIFGDVEFFRYRSESEAYSLVPTDEQKSGQFSTAVYLPTSYSSKTLSRSVTFPNQAAFASGAYNPAAGTLTYQIPSPNSAAIGATIDPIAQSLLQYYPEPNLNLSTSPNANPSLANSPVANTNFFNLANGGTNNYRWDTRVDEVLSANQTLFGRYSSEQVRNLLTSSLPPLNGQYYAGGGANYDNSQAFAAGYNLVLSANLLGAAHVGWNKIFWKQGFPNQSLTGVGIPGVPNLYPGFSEMSVSSYATIGVSNTPNSDDSQDREIAADITWNHGAHTLKFGWQEFWLQTNFDSSQETTGIFTFSGVYSEQKPTSTASLDQKFADFLLGDASAEKLSDQSILNFRSDYTHFFVQDDWKASRSLTLNLGLRYELSPPAVDKFNKIANFDEDSNPSNPQLIYAGEYGRKRDQRALQNLSYTNFAPRIGFAFSPEGSKTVMRGGYGIFYSNAITIGGMQSMENNPPVNQLTLLTTPSKTTPNEFLQQGFAPGAISFSGYNGSTVTLVSFDRHAVIPTDQQWNLNIQRALPYGIVTEVGYSGNKFDHNWWQVDGNPGNPLVAQSLGVTSPTPATRPYHTATIPGTSTTLNLGTVSRVSKEGWSHYNGLQVKAEKRYARGLTFLGTYSYSKTIGVGDASNFQNINDIQAERAVTSTNLKHHFVLSGVYPLPFGRGQQFGANWNRWVDGALGGWSFSPILTVNSGPPVSLTASGNLSTTGDTDRPNLVGNPYVAGGVAGNTSVPGCGPNSPASPGYNASSPAAGTYPAGSSAGAPTQVRVRTAWFNPCAYAVNSPYTFGDVGRNSLVGPGSVNLDVSVHKTFAFFTERVKAQLRLEAFNVANHPNLGSPGSTVQTSLSTSTLGVISGAAGNPRQVQAAIKILF